MSSELIITLAIIATFNLLVLVIVGRKINVQIQKGKFRLSWERNQSLSPFEKR